MNADGFEPSNQDGTGLQPVAFNHFAKRPLIAYCAWSDDGLLIVSITSELETLVDVYWLAAQPFYLVLF